MKTAIVKPLFRFISLILILAIAGTVGAQSEFVTPSGMDETALTAAVDKLIQENESTTAGAAFSVFRNDQTILERYVGEADLENAVPVSEETVFEWGSATKMLVWVSALQLWEQGKLDLETDVRTYLPEGFFTKRKNDDPITYLNLMHHNAGWEEGLKDLFLSQGTGFNGLETELKTHEPIQIYETGQYTAYSNWGVALAGHIIERISGLTFSEYVHQNIFEPLGMTQTALLPDLADNPWVQSQRSFTQGYTTTNQLISPNWFQINLYPAGMATGTLRDFELFGKALAGNVDGSTPLFQDSETLKKLLEPTLFYGDQAYPRNAHGFWVSGYAVPVYGHGGNTATHSAMLWIDPVSHIGAVLLTNQANEAVFNKELGMIIYGDFQPLESATNPESVTEGVYQISRTIQNGFGKIYGLVNRIVLKKTDTGYEGSAPGLTIPLQFVAADLVTSEGMMASIDKDPNENEVIRFYVMDLYKIPELQNTLEWVFVGLWVAAVLYSLIMLILALINAVRVKRGKSSANYGADGKRALIYLVTVLTLIPIIFLVLGVAGFQHSESYRIYPTILLAVMVLQVALFAWQFVSLFFSQNTPRVRGILACLTALISATTIYYWQFYQF